MKHAMLIPALLTFLIQVQHSRAATILSSFADDACHDSNPVNLTGSEDGLCTPFVNAFGSFKIAEIDAGFGVTVYGAGNLYCGLDDKWLLQNSRCYSNTSINQFTVDATSIIVQSSSSSIPTTLQTTATAYISPSSSINTSSFSSSSPPTSNAATSTSSDASTLPSSSGSTSSQPEDKDGLSPEGIIGLSVGLPGALMAIATAVVYLIKKRR